MTKIWGTICISVPHCQFWGIRPPVIYAHDYSTVNYQFYCVVIHNECTYIIVVPLCDQDEDKVPESPNDVDAIEATPKTAAVISSGNKASFRTGRLQGKKRKQANEDLMTLAKQCFQEIQKLNDDDNSGNAKGTPIDDDGKYGEYIATEMRKIKSEETKLVVKAEIQHLFLKAGLGQLNPPSFPYCSYKAPNQWSQTSHSFFAQPQTYPNATSAITANEVINYQGAQPYVNYGNQRPDTEQFSYVSAASTTYGIRAGGGGGFTQQLPAAASWTTCQTAGPSSERPERPSPTLKVAKPANNLEIENPENMFSVGDAYTMTVL